MVTKKKTLYEILAVAADASEAELQAAFDAAMAQLASQKDRISADDFDFKVKVLQLAFKTLRDPGSRGAYDAKLASTAVPPAPPPAAPELALVPLQADAEALSLRAEAMALRAPVKYWDSKRKTHRCWSIVFGVLSFAGIAGAAGGLAWLVQDLLRVATPNAQP